MCVYIVRSVNDVVFRLSRAQRNSGEFAMNVVYHEAVTGRSF